MYTVNLVTFDNQSSYTGSGKTLTEAVSTLLAFFSFNLEETVQLLELLAESAKKFEETGESLVDSFSYPGDEDAYYVEITKV